MPNTVQPSEIGKYDKKEEVIRGHAMLQNRVVGAIVFVAISGAAWLSYDEQIVAWLFPTPPQALTAENFKSLYVGMSHKEAVEILGPPTAQEGGGLSMWWSEEIGIELLCGGAVCSGHLRFKNGEEMPLPTKTQAFIHRRSGLVIQALIFAIGVVVTVFLLNRGSAKAGTNEGHA